MVCVVDILKILNSGDNFIYPIKNYNKIGVEIEDNFNMFTPNKKSINKFRLISSKDRLNLSVEFKICGKVTLNPIQAKKLNMSNEIKNVVTYKNYTIVQDGKLNIEKLELLVDSKTYIKLQALSLNIKNCKPRKSGFHIILNLKDIPIINTEYQNFNLIDVKDNLLKLIEAESKLKVLRYLKKDLYIPESLPGLTKEQTELAAEYGIDKYLNYTGIDLETKESKETYKAKVIQFKLKGCPTCSMNDVMKRLSSGKELNFVATIMNNYRVTLEDTILNKDITNQEKLLLLDDITNEITSNIYKLRFKNLIMRMAIYNTPLNEIVFDDNGKYQNNNLIITSKEMEFEK